MSAKPVIRMARFGKSSSGGNDVKGRIAKILNIQISSEWTISDSRPQSNLYMVHFTPLADLSKYGTLRGVVVDIKAGLVIARGFPEATIINTASVQPKVDGAISLVDQLGNKQSFNLAQTSFYPGLEGVTIMVFKHEGVVYFSSYHKFDISRSWRGKSPLFKAIYDSLGGPTADQLFDPTKKYSPYYYKFMIVHPELLYVSRANVGDGYIVFLGMDTAWGSSPYPSNEIETGYIYPPVGTDPNSLQVTPTTRLQVLLSYGQVNYYLRFGSHQQYDDQYIDPRLGSGEFVAAYVRDATGNLTHLLHIQGTAYEWRSSIRDGEANLELQFYRSTNDTRINTNRPSGLLEFKRRYPIFPPIPVDDVINEAKTMVIWPLIELPTDSMVKSWEQKYYNIWAAIVVTAPPQQRSRVTPLYHQFKQDRIDVANWLKSLYDTNIYADPKIGYVRVKQLVESAIQSARDETSRSREIKLTISQLVHKYLDQLILVEEGRSLYTLIKTMKRYRKFRAMKQKKEMEKLVQSVGNVFLSTTQTGEASVSGVRIPTYAEAVKSSSLV